MHRSMFFLSQGVFVPAYVKSLGNKAYGIKMSEWREKKHSGEPAAYTPVCKKVALPVGSPCKLSAPAAVHQLQCTLGSNREHRFL